MKKVSIQSLGVEEANGLEANAWLATQPVCQLLEHGRECSAADSLRFGSADAPEPTLSLSRKLPSFCIILPMYNEEYTAKACALKVDNFLKTVPSHTAIVAVNDGSNDNTAAVLKTLQNSLPDLIIETHEQNNGYGTANRTGFKAAIREGFEYALVMDADGTQNPSSIEGFFAPMCSSIDFIKATRYSCNSYILDVSWRRKFVSWAGNKLARFMLRLPISDYTNGFRAIKTSLLARLQTEEKGFAMLIEEVVAAKALGASFAEVPYTLTARNEAGSKSKFVYNLDVYKNYLKYLFKS